jgi:hypothetical protein
MVGRGTNGVGGDDSAGTRAPARRVGSGIMLLAMMRALPGLVPPLRRPLAFRGRGAKQTGPFHVVLVAVAFGILVATLIVAISTRGHEAGMDFWFYRDIGARWLSDGTYYTPTQLAGRPYELEAMVDVLYPPTALALFVPFVFVPAILWWVIPLGVLAYVVWSYRPSPWAWVVIAFLVAWPRTFGAVLFGNTDMWMAAGVAGGLRWGWPVALIAVKPTFAPFALVGVKRLSTWIVGGVLALASLPLLSDYITAMTNLRVDGFAYAAVSLPFALIPLAAWLGRTREPRDVES